MIEWSIIALVGFWAGMINSVVGSGTLVTFPTLVWLGVPPITANISNNLGLVPGAITGFVGTRDQLGSSITLLSRLVWLSGLGGLAGALLLVTLPDSVFQGVVPMFIIGGVLLVLFAPALKARRTVVFPTAVVFLLVFITGIYGGYFGAAQGIILLGVLNGIGGLHLHQANAVKNALIAVVNGVASVIFLASGHIDWAIVFVIALFSSVGAWTGARYGRRLPINVYRAVIVFVGTIAASWFLLT